MEICGYRSILWATLLACIISAACGCADGPGDDSGEFLRQSFLMHRKFDGRVVASFQKSAAESYGPADSRPLRRRPLRRNRQDRPMTNSFGAAVEGQFAGSRPVREGPVSFGNIPNYVLASVGNKVQGVSSFVQNIPEILTTISSTMLGASRPVSNADGHQSPGAVQYPARPNRPVSPAHFPSQNPSEGSGQSSSSFSNVPENSPVQSNPASVPTSSQDNPFPVVIIEPSQNQANYPLQTPTKGRGEPAIPVASGGAVPPSDYVPSDDHFTLNNFHIIDPANDGNQVDFNTAQISPAQSPQPTGANGSPSQTQNNFPNRVPVAAGSGFGGSQNAFNARPSQAEQSTDSLSVAQNAFDQQSPSVFSVVNGIQEFTLDLISTFRALGTKGNVVFSPISITSLLSLLTLGTKGLSSQEIEVALHLPNSQSSPSHHSLYENILRRLNHESSGVNITTASRLFMEETIPVYSSFTTQAAQHYNCSVSLENFRQRPTQTQTNVNQWVKEATQGKITDFITSPFSPDTMFVAANTIYFNGQWETPFPEYFTGPRDFDTGREVIRVPMMTNVFQAPHFYSPEYNLDVTSVPYVGGEFSMVILLPRESPQEKSIKLLERQLDTFLIDEFIANMTRKSLSLSLPKMRLRMKSSLVDSLSQLNIKSIFSSLAADFSGLSSRQPLWVSQFLHEAIMEVTEVGTVAAAVSGATLDRMGGYQRINVNKPAIIFIRDNVTRLPLFWVRLTKPDVIS